MEPDVTAQITTLTALDEAEIVDALDLHFARSLRQIDPGANAAPLPCA